MIQMLVTDLDGTLLRTDKSVSKFTVEVLARCRDQGMKIGFATARPKRGVFEYLNILEMITFDFMVFHNGAVVLQDGVPELNFGIPPKTAKVLAKQLASCGFAVGVEISDENWTNYDAPPGERVKRINDFGALPNEPADKIIVRKPSKSDISKIEEMLPGGVYLQINESVLGLIMSKSATKLNALEQLAARYGIELADVIAFGDDYNDIDMLAKSGIGVAVGNAIPEAKQAADFICDDNDNDGLAKWLVDKTPNYFLGTW